MNAHTAIAGVFLALLIAAPSTATPPDDGQKTGADRTFEGLDVAQTFRAVIARSDVTVVQQEGWTIVTESGGLVVWSFVPDNHPAYPSVVRRQVTMGPEGATIDMEVQCEAIKQACDRLVAEFEALNEQMRRSLAK